MMNPQLELVFKIRQRARTDLMFLMQDLLGYKDVNPDVHGPIIDKLQHFRGGTDALGPNGQIQYRPHMDLWYLEGKRSRLILDPRGHLKTTIISISHDIQWIINYPDVRILITTATGDLSEKVLRELKGHFQHNEKFRYYFPDFCPTAKRAGDFGNMESFTVPNRKRVLKEPTVSTSSIGKSVTGSHFEILDCCDMVDEINSQTPGGIRSVIDHFAHMDPLLERSKIPPHTGWVNMEGTRYDFGDLYGTIIDAQEQTPETEKWEISIRDAEVDATTETTLWPDRYPWRVLKAMEARMGPQIYSAQMRNRPIPSSGGLATLEDLIGIWLSSSQVWQMIRDKSLSLHCTVDLAAMDEKKAGGDFIVLTVAGFNREGKMIVVDIRRGHFTETEVIDQFYYLARLYPDLLDFKIEKEAYWRTLAPFLKREQFKRGFLPPIIDIKRDNHKSKQERIRGLQPWFKAKLIQFSADLPCRTDLFQEITRFPSQSVHDDILDTLADQLQNRDGGVTYDVVPAPWSPPIGHGPNLPEQQFLEFDPFSHEARFMLEQVGAADTNYDSNGI